MRAVHWLCLATICGFFTGCSSELVVYLVNDAGTEIVVKTNEISGRVVGPELRESWIRYGEGANVRSSVGGAPSKITIGSTPDTGGRGCPIGNTSTTRGRSPGSLIRPLPSTAVCGPFYTLESMLAAASFSCRLPIRPFHSRRDFRLCLSLTLPMSRKAQAAELFVVRNF